MPEKEISLAPLPFFNPRRKVLLIIFSGLFLNFMDQITLLNGFLPRSSIYSVLTN